MTLRQFGRSNAKSDAQGEPAMQRATTSRKNTTKYADRNSARSADWPPPHFLKHAEDIAVTINTRARQSTPLAGLSEPTYYIVRNGVFYSAITLPNQTPQITEIFTPGDIVPTHALPNESKPQLTCASRSGVLWRLRWTQITELQAAHPTFLESLTKRLIQQSARLSTHTAILNSLTGEERVSAFITELAIRTGHQTPAGTTFEMPFRRTDIAMYLGLNPDTVSRILSRMRSTGLISPVGIHREFCTDGDVLQQSCAVRDMIALLANPRSTDKQRAA